MRGIPRRRFDWDPREWWAPADDWAGIHVAEVLERFPELRPRRAVDAWLAGLERRWVGAGTTTRHDGSGWWVLRHAAGTVPDALAGGAVERDGVMLAPLTRAGARALGEERSARLDAAAQRCVRGARARARTPPPARLRSLARPSTASAPAPRRRSGTPTPARPSSACPAPRTRAAAPLDPWVVEPLDASWRATASRSAPGAQPVLDRAARRARRGALDGGRALAGDRRRRRWTSSAAAWAATLEPFQRAGVRYVLDARRTFLADEQGLGKTVQALAALEADDAFPAVVVCPASLKLNWEREAARWLPHRSARGRLRAAAPSAPAADLTILNYEIVEAHRDGAARGAARARSSSTSRTWSRTRAPSARARCAGWPTRSRATGCASR